jgi:hypothetical protein
MKYRHPHLPLGQHISVSTLVIIIKYNYTDKTQINNTLMTLAIFWYSKFDYLKWLNVKLLTNNVFNSPKHLDDFYFWNQ